mgnify:CR=1 FL=1|jgi:hypothetical protein
MRLGDLRRAAEAQGSRLVRLHSLASGIVFRMAPFELELSRQPRQATFRFARFGILTTPVDVDAIMAGYDLARATLDTAFDPHQFFDDVRRAYAEIARADGDRVELNEILPYVARRRGTRYRAKTRRLQFAYDMMRLVAARGLSQDGRRLNLGVATGTTAYDKSRVIFFENAYGDGEYKLTVFFTPVQRR